ncbi:MAG: 1-(5-phosphoribosyl)-5-[(5-phosphoribosylamino)methylideneamino] imidazole-4-carboxamide isomerase [Planctomycetes bacterium]|nr:1-(5-phosphoribosyl)-5-[(5-phosphoribosylamino)methylideneamino] imidazole-4-carboxamide isomerase [Planctomycetota bacterium]
MKAIPAIDLREGACVQLVGGRYDDERIRLPDAIAVAARWRAAGFTELHVVDLDAATGRGHNRPQIGELVRLGEVQVGGGVRDEAAIAHLLDLGAARVVLGTRAVEEPSWLVQMATRFPQRIVLAADVRERWVVTRGWAQRTELAIEALLERVGDLPLAAVLITAVHKEGLQQGTDLELFRGLTTRSRVPIAAAGGITTIEDLRALEQAGCQAAVLGMSLYTGRLDAATVSKEFAS